MSVIPDSKVNAVDKSVGPKIETSVVTLSVKVRFAYLVFVL